VRALISCCCSAAVASCFAATDFSSMIVASLFLHGAVFFKKLIQQHRVHRFVANRVSFSVSVAGHQIGIHLFHVLSHEAKLRDAIRVEVVLA